jgi:hypothetical protein
MKQTKIECPWNNITEFAEFPHTELQPFIVYNIKDEQLRFAIENSSKAKKSKLNSEEAIQFIFTILEILAFATAGLATLYQALF